MKIGNVNYYALPELKKRNIKIKFAGCNKKEDIIEIVCEWFNVPRAQLNKKSRERRFVLPRQICMYFLKEYTVMSLYEIGIIFGGRDHTTAIHSIRTVKALKECYEAYENDVKAIEEKITQKIFE